MFISAFLRFFFAGGIFACKRTSLGISCKSLRVSWLLFFVTDFRGLLVDWPFFCFQGWFEPFVEFGKPKQKVSTEPRFAEVNSDSLGASNGHESMPTDRPTDRPDRPDETRPDRPTRPSPKPPPPRAHRHCTDKQAPSAKTWSPTCCGKKMADNKNVRVSCLY